MFVSRLRLVNFRSYCDATVRFGPGLNVVVGRERRRQDQPARGAWFALRGSSPRTRRDEKLIAWGERFARVELELGDGRRPRLSRCDVAYAPGQGKRVALGRRSRSPRLDDLRRRSQVFIFVPESLLLVKGSPARRRAHLDAFAAALDPQYAAAAARRCRGCCASATPSSPRSRTAPTRRRSTRGTPSSHGSRPNSGAADATWWTSSRRSFTEVAAALAPAGERFTLRLVAQLESVAYDADALLQELRARRPGEVGRGLSLFGPHRDDLKFIEIGADPAGPSGGVADPADLGPPPRRPPPRSRR